MVVVPETIASPTTSVSYIPKATAFRMSGDFADHVAVTFGADGNLVYFPAPSDITASSCPVEIGDGWWLNCQGLGAGSVFTKWTFDQYRALDKAPTPEQIKQSLIPGAYVTDFKRLPITLNQARAEAPTDLLKYLEQ